MTNAHRERKMTLANVYEKLKDTSETMIMLCILFANTDKILRDLFMCLFWLLRALTHMERKFKSRLELSARNLSVLAPLVRK